MYKKLLVFCLLLFMMTAAIPKVSALEPEEIEERIVSDYSNSLAASERDTLAGYCGLLAGWQLYFRGINAPFFAADGNDYFDIYKDMSYTTGGFPVTAYSAESYTLGQALNAVSENGTRDVQNVLVGFQWTNTDAGQKYGHVVLIYAIQNGMVYFTESFNTAFGVQAGEMMKVSIERFENYYSGWMQFEGIICFGGDDYLSRCTRYPSNIYIETEGKNSMLAEPHFGGENPLGRDVLPGEKLWVTGVLRNPEGELFYEIEDGMDIVYLTCDETKVLGVNEQAVTYSAAPGQLSGRLTAQYCSMSAVYLDVYREDGSISYSRALQKNSRFFDLGSAEMQAMITDYDHTGTPVVTAEVRNYYVEDGHISCMDTLVEPVYRSSSLMSGNIAGRYDSAWMYYCWKNKIQTGWVPYSALS